MDWAWTVTWVALGVWAAAKITLAVLDFIDDEE